MTAIHCNCKREREREREREVVLEGIETSILLFNSLTHTSNCLCEQMKNTNSRKYEFINNIKKLDTVKNEVVKKCII